MLPFPNNVCLNNQTRLLKGETPLHTACQHGLANLTAELLQQGANPNIQTEKAVPAQKGANAPSTADSVYLQTPLHMAIAYNHPDVVSVILEQKGKGFVGWHTIIILCIFFFTFTFFLWVEVIISANPTKIFEHITVHGCNSVFSFKSKITPQRIVMEY